jgi:hypothetical protein
MYVYAKTATVVFAIFISQFEREASQDEEVLCADCAHPYTSLVHQTRKANKSRQQNLYGRRRPPRPLRRPGSKVVVVVVVV